MRWLRGILYTYGVINILGGVAGFAQGKSLPSLVIGGLVGVLLILLTAATVKSPGPAFRTLGVVVLGLVGLWGYRFSQYDPTTGKLPMVPVSNLALACLVFGILIGSHFTAVSKSRDGS
ncbi:MAG: TMEM14 family protein [Fimbriimonadales bacterium]